MTVGLLSFTSSVLVVQPIVKPFNIVLQYSTAAQAQPQAWKNGVQTAANVLMTLIKDTATVTIAVATLVGSAGGSAGPQTFRTMTYTDVKSALILPNPTASYTSWLNALPAGSTFPGRGSTFTLTGAVAKARGLTVDNPGNTDGTINLGDGITPPNIVGCALHEISHALGRSNDEPTFQWGKYTASGTRAIPSFTGTSYFSVDDGATDLANYDTSIDPSDFRGDTRDVFNASYDPLNPYTQALSALDIQLMETIGYSVQ